MATKRQVGTPLVDRLWAAWAWFDEDTRKIAAVLGGWVTITLSGLFIIPVAVHYFGRWWAWWLR